MGAVSADADPHGAPRERLWAAIERLERWGAERDWLGSDPYEGLNARRLRSLARGRLGRRLLIQAVKRSPLDARPLLGITAEHDAAATGHLLSAYSRLAEADLAAYRPWIGKLVARLGELMLDGWSGAAWGYHFDVETRFFHYSRSTPNTIATVFAAHGLLAAHEAGNQTALELASSAVDFILADLELTPAGAGAYFGYFPGDRTPIHNASALAAGLLARYGELTADRRVGEPVRAASEYAKAGQRDDGSWPYAERPGLDWVDGFHTGYVLEALARIHAADPAPELGRALTAGYGFYIERLIDRDGAPRYFASSRHPIDSQALAQALATFAIPAPGNPGPEAALPVLAYGLSKMRNRDGSFVFQRGRLLVKRTPHIRWTQAPMLDGMTALWRTLGG